MSLAGLSIEPVAPTNEHQQKWLIRVGEVEAFREANAGAWPQTTSSNAVEKSLGKWLGTQRRDSKKGERSFVRFGRGAILDARLPGWLDLGRDGKWRIKFDAILHTIAETADLPQARQDTSPEDHAKRGWLATQRRLLPAIQPLQVERSAELNAKLPFWDRPRFMRHLYEVSLYEAYVAEHGHEPRRGDDPYADILARRRGNWELGLQRMNDRDMESGVANDVANRFPELAQKYPEQAAKARDVIAHRACGLPGPHERAQNPYGIHHALHPDYRPTVTADYDEDDQDEMTDLEDDDTAEASGASENAGELALALIDTPSDESATLAAGEPEVPTAEGCSRLDALLRLIGRDPQNALATVLPIPTHIGDGFLHAAEIDGVLRVGYFVDVPSTSAA